MKCYPRSRAGYASYFCNDTQKRLSQKRFVEIENVFYTCFYRRTSHRSVEKMLFRLDDIKAIWRCLLKSMRYNVFLDKYQ